MKKAYSVPIVEKVAFDYKMQTAVSYQSCYGSVMNLTTDAQQTTIDYQCVGGTAVYIGWNSKNPGDI